RMFVVTSRAIPGSSGAECWPALMLARTRFLRTGHANLSHQNSMSTQPPRRPNLAAETELAQLFQYAHDAGDADSMRSLGRELEKRGWEYGETTPGWPYIKPPAAFQPDPGVDATASLRAANTGAQVAVDLPHSAAPIQRA